MIDYETFCKIRDYHGKQGLKPGQIARALMLDQRTVARWINEARYLPRQSSPRGSKLDLYKPLINQWLESPPIVPSRSSSACKKQASRVAIPSSRRMYARYAPDARRPSSP